MPTRYAHRSTLVLILLVMALAPLGSARAQSFSLNADIVSRYIWRGLDYGESVSIQPALTFTAGGFSIGSWANYGFSPDAGGANEHDLWASYTFETASAGSFSLGLTDYYFPNLAPDFFDYADGGSHAIEPFVSYTGPESFPVTLFGGMFVHNDDDNSVYLSATYPFTVSDVDLAFTAAGSPAESALYATGGPALLNVSLTASKTVPITESFGLPLSVSYIVNPYHELSFLVFGVRL